MVEDGKKRSQSDPARYANGRPAFKDIFQGAGERAVDVQLDVIVHLPHFSSTYHEISQLICNASN